MYLISAQLEFVEMNLDAFIYIYKASATWQLH